MNKDFLQTNKPQAQSSATSKLIMPGTPSQAVNPKAKAMMGSAALSRSMAVGSLLSLIVLGLGWEIFWAPTGIGPIGLSIKILPLTLPLAGLLKNRMYTYRWVSLLVWLYFAEGVIRAIEGHSLNATLAASQAILCLLLFVACAWHIRSRLSQAR